MKNQTKIIRLIAISLLALTSCINNSTDTKEQSLEVDNSEANTTSSSSNTSTYIKEVTIGKQVWMSENLNVSKFRNGDPIPEAKTEGEWRAFNQANEPAWCYYQNDPKNGERYGKLYNWYAINDSRVLAPEGWHIPSVDDWNSMGKYLGGNEMASAKMRSNTGWDGGLNGTNSSGFSALPSGFRDPNGNYLTLGRYAIWWSSTEYDKNNSWCGNVITDYPRPITHYEDKGRGLAVRCIKD